MIQQGQNQNYEVYPVTLHTANHFGCSFYEHLLHCIVFVKHIYDFHCYQFNN